MYWIREFEELDLVQVYEESEIHKGWKIIYQTYGIEEFNKKERMNFE